MNKYVFYLETSTCAKGNQLLFIDLASYLADNTDNEVYYINECHQEDLSRHEFTKLKFDTPDSFDFSSVADAIFFTPVNYLMHLLVRIKDIPDAKICLYQYNVHAITWLAKHLEDATSEKSVLDLIVDHNACAYLNYNCVYPTDTLHRYEDKIFFPTSLQEAILPKSTVDLLDEDIINIGYLGNLNEISYTSISNLFHNLGIARNTKRTNIHIIGNANISLNATFKQSSTEITRIIFTGALEKEDRKNYIRNNVDILFATDQNAIDAATYGVPVVIPVMDSKPFAGNNYVYLFDANGFIYSWNNATLLTLDNVCYKLDKIISDIYLQNRKKELADQCYEACLKCNSLESISEKFTMFVNESMLYVKNCLENQSISNVLEKYNDFLEDGNIAGFGNYLSMKNKSIGKTTSINTVEKKNAVSEKICKKIKSADNASKFFAVQKHYTRVKHRLTMQFRQDKELKVAFLVVFNSVFPTRPIFERMLTDPVFDPTIIVVPNVSQTMKYQIDLSNEAFNALSAQYPGKVINAYDAERDAYFDLKDEYQIIFFSNPYSHLVHPKHHVNYFLNKNVLTIYSSYGFAALKFWEEVIATDFYNYMWKCTLETNSNYEHLKSIEKIHGKNGVVTGYLKMDKLSTVKILPRERKRILICPHHTVWGWKSLNISNFLKYAEFFIELPKLFPQIDFIFRPHPLLFDNLKSHNIWTQQQINSFLEKLLENRNMIYDTSGDYFDKFANSDAMIHDCGSFIGEYLYTEKPCCYMMKTLEATMSNLVPFGQKCMEQYYHAFDKQDIINFIQNVVINGNDTKYKERINFVRNEIKVNYPTASQAVLDMIKKELHIKKM